MNNNIRIDKVDWHHDFKTLQSIRATVFIEEQHVPKELEWDGEDPHCTHVLAYFKQHAVGTARMMSNGHIGRMAVLKPYRGNGIGSALLNTLVVLAANLQLNSVYLHAQISAKEFYSKHGFVSYGDIFMDAGIPHIAMRLILNDKLLNDK